MPNSTKARSHNDFLEFTDISQFTQSESFSGTSDFSFHDDKSFSAITDKYLSSKTASNTSRIYVKPSSLSENIHEFDDDDYQSEDHVDLDKPLVEAGLSDHDLSERIGCDEDISDNDDLDNDGDDISSSDDDIRNEAQSYTDESDDSQSLKSSSGFHEDISEHGEETNHILYKAPIIVNPYEIRYRGFETYSEAIEFIGKVPVIEPRPVDETSDTASRIELDLLYDSMCNARNEAYKEKMKKKRKKSSALKRLFLSCFPCFKKNKIEDEDNDDVTSSIVIV